MRASMQEKLSSFMTPTVVGQAGTALGETPAAVSRAMSAVFPVLLKGLALGVRQPRCRNALFALTTHKSNDGRQLSSIGELFAGQSQTASALGDRMLHTLFGSHIGMVAEPIADYAGIEPRSARVLLSGAAQLVLADLGQLLRSEERQTPTALSSLVSRHAPAVFSGSSTASTAWDTVATFADRPAVSAIRLGEAARTPADPTVGTVIGTAAGAGVGSINRPLPGPFGSPIANPPAGRSTAEVLIRRGVSAASATSRVSVPGETAGRALWSWIWLPVIGALALAFLLLNIPELRPWGTGTSLQTSNPRPVSAIGPRGSRLSLNVTEDSVEARVVRYIESTRPLSTADWFELDRITFQTASNALTSASAEQVRNIAAILNAYPTVRLKVGGYTDNVGDPAANLRLSDARANTVMRELISLGIAPDRLIAEGYGELHPVADNATAEGRARNRRIAFRITQR